MRVRRSCGAVLVVLLCAPAVWAHTVEEEEADMARPDAGAGDLAPPDLVAPPDLAPPEPPSPPARVYESVVVGKRPMTAASAMSLENNDFDLRPKTSPNDLLRFVPGLLAVQHQGGGKADQYFLRGFDADHGTDVGLYVDGVPINLPSHAHGQGFTDLHWLIPEAIERIDVTKGPYDARWGDFATGGAINLVTRQRFDASSVSMTLGGFPTRGCENVTGDCKLLAQQRLVAIAAPNLRSSIVPGLVPWLAVEVARDNGPFDAPQGLQRYNVFGKLGYEFSRRLSLTLFLSAYGSAWKSSGQIPSRAVASGELGHFGAEDASEGGQTQRVMLNLALHYADTRHSVDVQVYYTRYKMKLWNDFTFFLRDPLNSDLIEQDDDRSVVGLNASYHLHRRWHGYAFRMTLGAQARFDAPFVQLWASSSQNGNYRKRLADYDEAGHFALPSQAAIQTLNLSAWAELDVTWNRWVRTVVAARADYFGFMVDDKTEVLGAGTPPTSGESQRGLVSPKATVVISPHRWVDLYLNFGMGFHSNDARIAVQNDRTTPDGNVVNVVPRFYGGEVGLRWNLWRRASIAVVGWASYLENETKFVGDGAIFEPSDPSRRFGVDVAIRAQPLSWLSLDFDLSQARTQSVTSSAQLALAPKLYMTGGVTVAHPKGVRAGLRFRYLGARPAFDTDSDEYRAWNGTEPTRVNTESFFVVDLYGAYRFRWFEVSVQIQNLANTRWREAQFGNSSCTRAETTNPLHANAGVCNASLPVAQRTGAADVHYTPGVPLNLQLQLKAYF